VNPGGMRVSSRGLSAATPADHSKNVGVDPEGVIFPAAV
jgi:hypothetical protein